MFSLGYIVLHLVLIAVGAVVLVPMLTMSIRYFDHDHDPGMAILGFIGAAGWIASMIWFARTLRTNF
jgi:hypothetical protein